MVYIPRTLERKFLHMSEFFKAVMVTGARQVGKTTMLKQLAEGQKRTYVTMDNAQARDLAKSDPVMFFQLYPPPVILDEIQKAPELLEQIKIMCDETEEKGLFWLTGSQHYGMMKNVRESLAGRVGILELYSLSRQEVLQAGFKNPLDFSLPCLLARQKAVKPAAITDIFGYIWRGGMPAVQAADAEQRDAYYNSYLETYLMRDVAELGGVTDTVRFRKFMGACAALISEQLNYKTLAEAAGISQPTAKVWIELLQSMGIIYLLQPYANNELKRLTKTPKLYFCDTGLAAWLSMWLTRDTLMKGAASGHYFENYVVLELVKEYNYAPIKANLTYYRDSNAKEIDVIVEENGVLHPLEIKLSANPDKREVRKFQVLEKTNLPVKNGGIICMCPEVMPIDQKNVFIPCGLL